MKRKINSNLRVAYIIKINNTYVLEKRIFALFYRQFQLIFIDVTEMQFALDYDVQTFATNFVHFDKF